MGRASKRIVINIHRKGQWSVIALVKNADDAMTQNVHNTVVVPCVAVIIELLANSKAT